MIGKPEPGVYLFVGGCADGRRIEVLNPLEYIQATDMPQVAACISHTDNVPTNEVVNKQTYRLTQLHGQEQNFYVYLYDWLDGDDLLRLLIKYYH